MMSSHREHPRRSAGQQPIAEEMPHGVPVMGRAGHTPRMSGAFGKTSASFFILVKYIIAKSLLFSFCCLELTSCQEERKQFSF
jgi:hypothetical protein